MNSFKWAVKPVKAARLVERRKQKTRILPAESGREMPGGGELKLTGFSPASKLNRERT